MAKRESSFVRWWNSLFESPQCDRCKILEGEIEWMQQSHDKIVDRLFSLLETKPSALPEPIKGIKSWEQVKSAKEKKIREKAEAVEIDHAS